MEKIHQPETHCYALLYSRNASLCQIIFQQTRVANCQGPVLSFPTFRQKKASVACDDENPLLRTETTVTFSFASYSCSRKHHAEMSVFAWLSVVTLTFAFKTLTKHWDGLFIKIMFCEIQFEIAKARASNQLGKKLFKAIYDQSTDFLSTYVFLPKTPSVPPQKKTDTKNSPNIPKKKKSIQKNHPLPKSHQARHIIDLQIVVSQSNIILWARCSSSTEVTWVVLLRGGEG